MSTQTKAQLAEARYLAALALARLQAAGLTAPVKK